MKTYSFEKLESWKSARILIVWVYRLTKRFPGEEKFGLISQMRRASVSVATNLAEGTSRRSKKEQAYFSTISYASAIELLNLVIIANDLEIISDGERDEGRIMIEALTLLIAGLRRSQLSQQF